MYLNISPLHHAFVCITAVTVLTKTALSLQDGCNSHYPRCLDHLGYFSVADIAPTSVLEETRHLHQATLCSLSDLMDTSPKLNNNCKKCQFTDKTRADKTNAVATSI